MRLRHVLAGVPITSTILLLGCDRGYSRDVVQTALSPNGRFEALVYEINRGATTSFGYEVDLRTVGDSEATDVAELYGAIRNEEAYGVNVNWSQPNALHVQYLRAGSVVSSRPEATIGDQQVTVSLDSGIKDPSAAAGGMLYNLKKR